MLRPGTVRGPALALAAFCAASSVAKSAAGLRWPAASCASAGKVSTRVRAIGMTPESDTTFIGFPPSAYTGPELLGVRLLAAIEVTSTVQRAPAGLGGRPPDGMSMKPCHRHDQTAGGLRCRSDDYAFLRHHHIMDGATVTHDIVVRHDELPEQSVDLVEIDVGDETINAGIDAGRLARPAYSRSPE